MNDRDWIRYLAARADRQLSYCFYLIDDRVLGAGSRCDVRPGLVGVVSTLAPPSNYHNRMASVIEVVTEDAFVWLKVAA